jgi:hypothetical protein
MPGSLHRVIRWLRLALACLTVAGARAPAHALPGTEPVVAVLAARRAPEFHTAVRAVASVRPGSQGFARPTHRASFPGRVREAHAPSPPRRLFLAQHALLH